MHALETQEKLPFVRQLPHPGPHIPKLSAEQGGTALPVFPFKMLSDSRNLYSLVCPVIVCLHCVLTFTSQVAVRYSACMHCNYPCMQPLQVKFHRSKNVPCICQTSFPTSYTHLLSFLGQLRSSARQRPRVPCLQRPLPHACTTCSPAGRLGYACRTLVGSGLEPKAFTTVLPASHQPQHMS